MRRSYLILGGTVAGAVGVVAFPTHSTKLSIPSSAATTTPTTAAPSGSSAPTSASTAPATAPTTAPAATTRSATSDEEQFRYGDMAVKVTVKGTRITGVSIAAIDETDGRSQSIDEQAVPMLEQQVISAGSVNVDGVSGATFTSQAFVDAVANALQKLGIST